MPADDGYRFAPPILRARARSPNGDQGPNDASPVPLAKFTFEIDKKQPSAV
jgi:hypothetical protein